MKKVKILLKTATVSGSERETSTFIYSGEYEKKDGTDYLRYSEITDGAKTDTTIKAVGNRVEITRSGAFGSTLIIEEGAVHKTEYKTPYGAFLMSVQGEKCKNSLGDGKLTAAYTLFNESGVIGQNEIEIKIKEV